MESKNPFAAIIDSYKYEVKKADERGLADTFKKCSEIFFRDVTNEEIKFNFRDVEYLDGYFLFGMGTNSVVHFHIDECPGWKFGIWWGDKDENNNSVSGEFFAQFEDTIDKFKPSASQYCISITIDLDDDNLWSLYDVRDEIKYIANEPYLAFCRDYCYWDYNREYHSREEAKAKYEKWMECHERKLQYTKIYNDKIIDYVQKRILPKYNGATLRDNGEECTPRYDVIAPLGLNSDIVTEAGWYWLPSNEDMNDLRSIVKECRDQADQMDFCWSSPVSEDILFYQENEEV